MSLDELDAGCLWDMLDAARAVERFIGNITRDAYLVDELIQSAVEQNRDHRRSCGKTLDRISAKQSDNSVGENVRAAKCFGT